MICNTFAVWQVAKAIARFPQRTKFRILVVFILGGILARRVHWALARQTLRKLPAADQCPLGVLKLRRDSEQRRSEALTSLTRNLRQEWLRACRSSLRRFLACSWKVSQLNDLHHGIGAPSGLSLLYAVFVGAQRPGQKVPLMAGVLRQIVIELSAESATSALQVVMVVETLQRFQDAIVSDFPATRAVLLPTMAQSLVAINALRVLQYCLALSPSAGHVTHLLGTALGIFSVKIRPLLYGVLRWCRSGG